MSKNRRHAPIFDRSAYADNIRAIAASIEAEGYTLRTLQNMEPQRLAELIDRHLDALPCTEELMRGTNWPGEVFDGLPSLEKTAERVVKRS